MKKRIVSMLLAVVMLLGMIPTVAFAADSEEEALGEVNIFNGGDRLSYLSINGRVRELIYTYYNHIDRNGRTKEIPAYCVNPNTKGVPQTVPKGQSIKYMAKEIGSDPKVVGIIANGYPTRSLGELKLENKQQAYYATKMALWCYLLSHWDINNLKVNPNLSGGELQRANKILAAAKDIYRRGTAWTKVLQPSIVTEVDQESAYPTTINGQPYYQQIFTVTSETWVCDYDIAVGFTDSSAIPSGTKIVDMNNKEISAVRTSGTGNGYSGMFKVIYPASSVQDKTGSVQLSLKANVYNYGVYYASCAEEDRGELQNYMCDTDPTRPMKLSAYSNYNSEPEDDPGETSMKIVKVEAGTTIPLRGAMFEVVDPEGVSIGFYSTNSRGEIVIPLTLSGNYTVYERQAPQDYLLSKEPAKNVKVEYGKQTTITFENEPYGNLQVKKYSNTGTELPGAVIKIKHIESGQEYTTETNYAGIAIFNEIKPGAYRIQEVASPAGYIMDDTVYTTTVVTGETAVVPIVNQEKPGLRILKYDSKTQKAMPDITFEIFKDSVSLGKMKTDEFGEILLTDLEPGTYMAKEVQTDPEHIINTTPQQIELEGGDGILELIFFNAQKPGIYLVKLDATTLQRMPNAKFRIEQVGGPFSKEYVTDEQGEIDLKHLEPGAYKVTEIAAPDGYLIDDAVRVIQINGNDNAEFVFTNTRKPSFRLVKLDSFNSTGLPGATFRIARIADGSHYLDRVTDTNGEINISDLEPGVYSVKEMRAPEGYIVDPTEYHVELFPGQVSELVVSNDRKPSLEIVKTDAITGAPVPGVTFTIKKVDSSTLTTLKTESDGKCHLEKLDPGVYEIWEQSVPDDYLLNKEHQLITLFPNRLGTVHFQNFPKPTLTINKIDSVTGNPIKGVKFHVTYGSNDTFTGEINDLGIHYTDENGQIKIGKLKDGWYKVTEVEAAPGYSIKEPATQECYIDAGRGKTLTFENTPLSALVVWKFDSVTGEAISNAVFQVKYLSGESGTGGTVIGTYRTSANGSFTVTGLKAGTYVVEELSSDGDHVIDSATHEPLSDVEFFITDSNGTVVGDSNGKFVTDSNGTILVDGIDPGTTLVAKETRTRDGYILDDTPQTARIRAGQTVTLEFRNAPKGGLIINKLDSKTGQPLKGVEFKITYSDGRYVDAANGQISSKGLYVTDANGQIHLTGVVGTLVVTETKTIEGYSMDPDTRTQTVQVNANDTQTITVYNDPLGCLLIKKVDSVTKSPLAGVEFNIKGCNGCEYPAGKYTTDANGVIRLKHIPSGCYAITETKAVDGYLLDDTVHTVKVEPGACKEVTFENHPLGGLVIKKMDSATKEPLANAIFRVTTVDGAVVGNTNGEYRTDERGFINIPDLQPGGYIVTELQAPVGYVLDDTPKTIQIKDHKTYELTFYNAPKGSLVIHKLDSVTKAPLEGVEFKITYSNGANVDADNGQLSSNGLYRTDKNGQIVIHGLVGTVVVTETKTIPGYVINTESRSQTVKINPNDTQTLYVYNDPIGGVEIIKVNEDDQKERIPNTTFEIRKLDDELIDTVTTDKNGRVFVPLKDGSYYAKEIKAAENFRLDDTPHYFEVEDGKTSQLVVTNKANSGIIIHKIDSVTEDGIYGVKFVLYDHNHKPIDEYTTDNEGYIYIDEIPGGLSGRFYLRELEAAPGYELDKQYKSVHVHPGKTIEIEWENTPISGQIQLTKYAAEFNTVTGTAPGAPLKGAVYEIINPRNNKVVDHITTDARGIAASRPLPLGRYQLREVTAPAYWQVDTTVHDVTLEYPGQIIKLSAFDKAAKLGVSITKRGNTSVLAGSQMRYNITVANTSNVDLGKFFWHDRIPTDIARATVLSTGTYSARLNYRVLYKTNYSANYQVLASNLLTSNNYTFALNAIPMQAGEVVTDVYFDFGKVPVGFQSVTHPTLSVMVSGHAVNGYQMVNRADVGGFYGGTWQTANASWVTIIQRLWNIPSLPKTGY